MHVTGKNACPVEHQDEMKPDQAALAKFECRGVCVTSAGCGEDSLEAERANQAAAPAKILATIA